jgi:hypothetical protein
MMISNMRAKGAFWDGLYDGRGRYRTKIPKKQTSCCMLFLSHSHATSFKPNASKMLCLCADFPTIIHTYRQRLSLNPSRHLSSLDFSGLLPLHSPHISSDAAGCS